MPLKKKSTNPDRVGLSLHKHLTPHVLEMSSTLDMNPNEFVNACVEQCVERMIGQDEPGPGAPTLIYRYRQMTGRDPQPISQRLTAEEYALVRGLEEVLYDLNLAKRCVLDHLSIDAVMSDAVRELLQQYREKRTMLIAQSMTPGNKAYPAPQTGI